MLLIESFMPGDAHDTHGYVVEEAYRSPPTPDEAIDTLPKKSSLKRGRTTGSLHGPENIKDNGKKASFKRQRSMNDNDTAIHEDITWARKYEHVPFDPIHVHDNKQMRQFSLTSSPDKHDNVNLYGNVRGHDVNEAATDTSIIDSTYQVHPESPTTYLRAEIDDPSFHDTEPVPSSESTQARRPLSSVAYHPQKSENTTVDTLTLSKHEIKNTGTSNCEESDCDELATDKYVGVRKESYDSRTTRLRPMDSDKSTGNNGGDKGGGNLAVVVPQVQCIKNTHSVNENSLINTHHHEVNGTDSNESSGVPFAVNTPISTPDREHLFSDSTLSIPQEPGRSQQGAKKKVKRGKTTSVMQRKAVDTDVEDDVIWVDEKPAKQAVPSNTTNQKGYEKGDNTSSNPVDFDGRLESRSEEFSASVVGPKKRGRKRKKTTDSTTIEPPKETATPNNPQALTEHNRNLSPGPSANEQTDSLRPINQKDGPSQDDFNQENYNILREDSASLPDDNKETTQQRHERHETPTRTPTKQQQSLQKGPDKHSPIAINKKVPYRVGLSRTARIAPLLKVIRR